MQNSWSGCWSSHWRPTERTDRIFHVLEINKTRHLRCLRAGRISTFWSQVLPNHIQGLPNGDWAKAPNICRNDFQRSTGSGNRQRKGRILLARILLALDASSHQVVLWHAWHLLHCASCHLPWLIDGPPDPEPSPRPSQWWLGLVPVTFFLYVDGRFVPLTAQEWKGLGLDKDVLHVKQSLPTKRLKRNKRPPIFSNMKFNRLKGKKPKDIDKTVFKKRIINAIPGGT